MDTVAPVREDFALLGAFAEFTRAPESFPLSFTLDGKHYHGLPGAKTTLRKPGSELIEAVSLLQIGDLHFRLEAQLWQDLPVAEWTLYIENRGTVPGGIVGDLLGLDADLPGKSPVLVTNNGDFYSPDGYTETRQPVTAPITLAPNGGRPCNGAFPYQRLLADGHGYVISIGWPGQWAAQYGPGEGGTHVTAGQETFCSRILPGETVRTPRIAVLAFTGDEARGINLWRRFYLAHVIPKVDGRPIPPMISIADNGGGIEFTAATEENQLAAIPVLKQRHPAANVWWIDAGWYPCPQIDGRGEWSFVGQWEPDPARFPRGFKPIAEVCKQNGLRLLVWFEPERVNRNSPVYEQLRPYLIELTRKDGTLRSQALLDLCNDECFELLCRRISGMIRENGIGIYRQDFNFDPLDYWRSRDTEDRRGAYENQYVQRYLAYFDCLLRENPGLIIDSCASGGRRNDLETMRRAVPLHPTDYGYGYHHINQAFRRTLYGWIPYMRSWGEAWDEGGVYYDHSDYYAVPRAPEDTVEKFRFDWINSMAVFSPAAGLGDLDAHPERAKASARLSRVQDKFSQLCLSGDYYPLTPDVRDDAHWTVFQFHRPDTGEGALQIFRNLQSKDKTCTVYLRGLDPCRNYRLEDPETGETQTRAGALLMDEGLCLSLPPRDAQILFYHETRM